MGHVHPSWETALLILPNPHVGLQVCILIHGELVGKAVLE